MNEWTGWKATDVSRSCVVWMGTHSSSQRQFSFLHCCHLTQKNSLWIVHNGKFKVPLTTSSSHSLGQLQKFHIYKWYIFILWLFEKSSHLLVSSSLCLLCHALSLEQQQWIVFFGELIRVGVFSHNYYVRSLIARGILERIQHPDVHFRHILENESKLHTQPFFELLATSSSDCDVFCSGTFIVNI